MVWELKASRMRIRRKCFQSSQFDIFFFVPWPLMLHRLLTYAMLISLSATGTCSSITCALLDSNDSSRSERKALTDTCHSLAGCFRALERVGLVLLQFGTFHYTLQLVKTPQFHVSVIFNVKKIFESVQNKTNSFHQNVSAGSSSAARCLLLEPMPCIANRQRYD